MKVFEDYLMFFTSDEKRLFYNKWLRPVSGEELRTGSELVLAQIIGSGAELWLLDASSCNTPCREDQEWIMCVMQELLCDSRNRLQRIALVKSRDVFFEAVAEMFRQRLSALPGQNTLIQYFNAVPEAYTWLFAATPHSPTQTAAHR